jgi:glucokinase
LMFQRRPRIARTAPGDQAGCLGAALLAWRLTGDNAASGSDAADAGKEATP